jgi:hypothetical protein
MSPESERASASDWSTGRLRRGRTVDEGNEAARPARIIARPADPAFGALETELSV